VEEITGPRAGLAPAQAFFSSRPAVFQRPGRCCRHAARINKMNSETKPSDVVGPSHALSCAALLPDPKLRHASSASLLLLLLDIMRYREGPMPTPHLAKILGISKGRGNGMMASVARVLSVSAAPWPITRPAVDALATSRRDKPACCVVPTAQLNVTSCFT
jgi:hypothetical protein